MAIPWSCRAAAWGLSYGWLRETRNCAAVRRCRYTDLCSASLSLAVGSGGEAGAKWQAWPRVPRVIPRRCISPLITFVRPCSPGSRLRVIGSPGGGRGAGVGIIAFSASKTQQTRSKAALCRGQQRTLPPHRGSLLFLRAHGLRAGTYWEAEKAKEQQGSPRQRCRWHPLARPLNPLCSSPLHQALHWHRAAGQCCASWDTFPECLG